MLNKNTVFRSLYFQVVLCIGLGICLGYFHPELGTKMKPLSDAFIRLVKMMIGPIIFATVVVGIGKMGDMREIGRVGVKSLFYFEVVSTIALCFGWIVVNILKPGVGINLDLASLDTSYLSSYHAENQSTTSFILNLIPVSVVKSFAENNILQILIFAILFGLALANIGERGHKILSIVEQLSEVLFAMIAMIMKLAPICAFAAMGFTVGAYGFETLAKLGSLVIYFYFTCFLFVSIVLGSITNYYNVSLWKFIKFIKEEVIIALATSSSESVLPRLMDKMEKLGCKKTVVGMVIPTGYSFNLDGTSIYLSMTAIFLSQALNIDLTIGQQISILSILFITSKGAAGVTGGGFIILLSTLATIDSIPAASIAILLGIDRFMCEARTITNLIGNGIAAIVISNWEKDFDSKLAEPILKNSKNTKKFLEVNA